MFLFVAASVLIIAILLIIFPEQIISLLLAQQHQLISFFSDANHAGDNPGWWQKIWDELLDDQQSNSNRYKYRKLWIRIWAFVLILFIISSLLFYWLTIQYPN